MITSHEINCRFTSLYTLINSITKCCKLVMEFPFPLVEKCKWAWFLGDSGSAFGTVNSRNRNFAFCYVVMTLYETCSKEIEWNQPGNSLQDGRKFTVEICNKFGALGSILSVKVSISELGNFPFRVDCESSLLCWQKHVTSFHPAPSEVIITCLMRFSSEDIYSLRFSEQTFLLICHIFWTRHILYPSYYFWLD